MKEAIKHVIEFGKRYKAKVVDLKFCTPIGRWHRVSLPFSRLNEDLFFEGESIDGSSTGFKEVNAGDMSIMPDPTTVFFDPFWDVPAISLICSVVETETKKPAALGPRVIAKKAEEYMKESGIATESIWGPEFEFYIFDKIKFGTAGNYSFYELDSEEGYWNSGKDREKMYHIPPKSQKGYHSISPRELTYNIRTEMSEMIEQLGIKVKYHHHEVGGPGQCEIEIQRGGPLTKMADNVMLIKYIIQNIAFKHGKTATFMPKPLFNEAGSGMHFHQQIMKNGEAIFYDENGYAGLSDTALYYIGGLLKHGKSLLAFTNPSTNSYKRLVPGFEAPTKLFFGLANRSAAIRIPKSAKSPKDKRIEFRTPDGTCNPYLAMAAMLMAGLDGIKNKIDPRELNMGPFDDNIFELSEDKLEKIPSCPRNLYEALEALKEDNDYLTAGGVFTKEFIDGWIRLKMQEVIGIDLRPHPYEIELYFDL